MSLIAKFLSFETYLLKNNAIFNRIYYGVN